MGFGAEHIFFFLSVCWAVQMAYYWAGLAQPYYYQRKINQGKITFPAVALPVSVVVYTRNEVEKLERCLSQLLKQDYPRYEVIVVDDGSTDDTELTLKHFVSRYANLYYTYVPAEIKQVSRKKLAITLGIKAAHYEQLLFIEANSYPASPDWLRAMARHFVGKTNIVLGFSTLEQRPSRFAVYDYFVFNLQMTALALLNRADTGNGKNLGYTKEAFARQRSFSDFGFLEAGYDDLLVNELAQPNSVAVELSPDSIVRVQLAERWMWKELKTGRMAVHSRFRRTSVVLRGVETASRIACYLLPVYAATAFASGWKAPSLAVFLFLSRFATQWIVINQTAKILKLPRFYFSLLIFDFIQPLVNGYFYLCGIFKYRKKRPRKYGK